MVIPGTIEFNANQSTENLSITLFPWPVKNEEEEMLVLNCRMERRKKTPTTAPKSERIIWVKWGCTSGFSRVQRPWPGVAVSAQVSLRSQEWHGPSLKSFVTAWQGWDDSKLWVNGIEGRSLEMNGCSKDGFACQLHLLSPHLQQFLTGKHTVEHNGWSEKNCMCWNFLTLCASCLIQTLT